VKLLFESEAERAHFDILLRALQVHDERSSSRGTAGWRRYGYKGAAFFLKDRANRIWDTVQIHRTLYTDDAIDIINYAVFAIRSKHEDNYGGEFWPG